MSDENKLIDPMSAEGEQILNDALGKDYGPGNTDPVMLAAQAPEAQASAKEWIDARQKVVQERWFADLAKYFKQEEGVVKIDLETPIKLFAREFADLENDFRYVKELNSYTAKRYQQVWDVLPSVQEMDLLIDTITGFVGNHNDFFTIGTKEDRLKKLALLREARRIDLSGR